jgi:hypothetical protein
MSLVSWHDLNRTEQLLTTDADAFRSDVRLLQGSVANAQSAEIDKLFARAAREQLAGKVVAAKTLALTGFSSSDLHPAQLRTVFDVIEASPARLSLMRSFAAQRAAHLEQATLMDEDPSVADPALLAEISSLSFRAGQEDQGYRYLAKYLAATHPEDQVTASFQSHFIAEMKTGRIAAELR